MGQAIHTASLYGSEGKYIIEMNNYPPGFYLIQLIDKNALNTIKIIKQ